MGKEKKELKWRNESQLIGVQSQVQAAINTCTNGVEITLDLKTAKNVIEIIKQARHTEAGHLSDIENSM